ncbi:MAG: metalloregulator ArsR/SmtB family transcription factor [Polyangiaceae bacterium]
MRPAGIRRDAFAAVADPKRRAILDALANGERSVSDLCELFAVSQPAVSQHLEVLREAGLVVARREGRHRFYRLEATPLRDVYDWCGHYQRFWEGKLDALGRTLDRLADREAPAKKKRSPS